jgi:hypothetical protein
MELVVEPDIYQPSIDNNGNYIDQMPSFQYIKKGVTCPCGSRKDKVFDCVSKFSAHSKTKIHQKWLAALNTNRSNFFVENEQLKETVNNQKLIISKMEKDIQTKIMTIDYLTLLLSNPSTGKTVNNLLDFD